MTNSARDAVRNGLLLDALGGPIDLNAVDWHVKHRNPSASPTEVQNETLDVIREWVSEGLFKIGAPEGKTKRFVAWHHSLDHSLHKISHTYVRHYDDPEKWMFSAFLALTAKGEELARCIEDKDIDGYRRKTP
jgi:hypothetical protein